MNELITENLFNLRGHKSILEMLEKKVKDKYYDLNELRQNRLDEKKKNDIINVIVSFGGNRTQDSLKKEVDLIGKKFDNLIDYASLILIGPKIYNKILEKISNRGNYGSYEALILDLIIELFVPLYKQIKKISNLTTQETFCAIHGFLREKPIDLDISSHFLEIDDSNGFFESFNLLKLSPYNEKIEKTEKDFKQNIEKEDLLDVIKLKYQVKDLSLKTVTDTMKPMQRIFSPIGNIERIITSIRIRKTRIDDFQEKNIEKSVYSIIRAIYELYSKEMVGKNKNFENFIDDICKNFADLIEKPKENLITRLKSKILDDQARDIIKSATNFIKDEIINMF